MSCFIGYCQHSRFMQGIKCNALHHWKCKLFRITHNTLLEGETFLRNKHEIAFFEIKCTFFVRKERAIKFLHRELKGTKVNVEKPLHLVYYGLKVSLQRLFRKWLWKKPSECYVFLSCNWSLNKTLQKLSIERIVSYVPKTYIL